MEGAAETGEEAGGDVLAALAHFLTFLELLLADFLVEVEPASALFSAFFASFFAQDSFFLASLLLAAVDWPWCLPGAEPLSFAGEWWAGMRWEEVLRARIVLKKPFE